VKNAEFGGSGWEWQRTRARILSRDGGICVMNGCNEPATIVDHIRRREHGGGNDDANLRSLCAAHNHEVTYR
jgi:5-methylcytosine-specific restriction enzyme A